MLDNPEKYKVLPSISRAQTAPSSIRTEKRMTDSCMQTFDNNILKSDIIVKAVVEDLDKNVTPTESRTSSPSGYMIAYKMADQKLHFDPGVYTDFKGIDSARLWLKKKQFLQKKGKKVNIGKVQKNLSAIDEDLESSRGMDKPMISSLNESESDDESLRREAVRQASIVNLEHIIDHPISNVLVFDASTQTVSEKKQKKVRISIKSPEGVKRESPKRLTIIEVKESKPTKYLDKYLSKGKKKTRKLPELEPLFSPVKQRPRSRSSSSRSSRSSSASEKKVKAKVHYSNIQAKVLSSDPQHEYQLDPYMPASWYLPYDYIDTPNVTSPYNSSIKMINATKSNVSKKSPKNNSIMSSMPMYSPTSQVSIYNSVPQIMSPTYSTSKPKKKFQNLNNPNNQYIDPNYQTNYDHGAYYQSQQYFYPELNTVNSKAFKSTSDLSYNRPWY